MFSCITLLDAKVEEHLKEALNKTEGHSLRNVDFIYMINLDKRPEKYAMSCSQLNPYGIFPYRFSAVNGWELPLEVINDVGLKYEPGMDRLVASAYPIEAGGLVSHEYMSVFGRTYFVHCMARGTIGIAMSHISVLKDAYYSGYNRIWVMEDDIAVIKDPRMIPDLIDELDTLVGKDNWDVLFTDQDYRSGQDIYVPAQGAAKRPDLDNSIQERLSDKYVKTEIINDHFKKIGARFGATSMIINRSGIVKLYQFALKHQIYLPYDMDNYLVPGIRRYGLRYNVVTNCLNALTDNALPGYLK